MVLNEANHSGALSSIALLQERFRQLQRTRELRQEKDLLRKLSEYDRSYSPPIIQYDPSPKTILRSELMFLPPKPHCQLSLSLWPDSQINSHGGDQATSSCLPAAKSWFADAAGSKMVCGSSIKFENTDRCDIDTSLHL